MADLSIKIPELSINKIDPWADDKLGRKACAEMLSSLLVSQTTALTVSANGEWGSGKTFLLKRWQQQLSNDGYTSIYFNAWEDDFMGDPLVALIGQLRQKLPEELNIKGVLKGIGSTVFSIASGMCKKKWGPDLIDSAERGQKAAASKRDNILDDYDKLCQSRTDLKTSLQKMTSTIFKQTGKPLVFIVDELDRCRPTFAIETLERIKHLFDIDHVVFVLGIDRKQLGKSIKSVYGNIETENYLLRFFDLDFMVPMPNKKKFFNLIWENYEIPMYLVNFLKTGDKRLHNAATTFQTCFSDLLLMHNFTLREIEQCVKSFIVYLRSSSVIENQAILFLFPALIILKAKNVFVYQRYTHGISNPIEVLDAILPNKINDIENPHLYRMVSVILSSFSEESQVTAVDTLVSALHLPAHATITPKLPKCIGHMNSSARSFLYEQVRDSKRLMRGHASVEAILNVIDFAFPND